MNKYLLFVFVALIAGCQEPTRTANPSPASAVADSTNAEPAKIDRNLSDERYSLVVLSNCSVTLITNLLILDKEASAPSVSPTNFSQSLPATVTNSVKFRRFLEICADRALDPRFVSAAAELLHEINGLKDIGESEEQTLLDKGMDLIIRLAKNWPETTKDKPTDQAAADGCCDQIAELAKSVSSMQVALGKDKEDAGTFTGQIQQLDENIANLGQAITNETESLDEVLAAEPSSLWPYLACFLFGVMLTTFGAIIVLASRGKIKVSDKRTSPPAMFGG
jgi:hypothetical protein